uniref:Lysophospholipase n=1 Tax=Kwoniella pini CBS 10737 TaxID=1296096 RepID=A0A1B9IA46_9TREE|nr:lysophospholipase [Kwoniella pini CBS 10737]OCF52353.1 lysophospholipase [Kwoniella pini CBS 10737]
MPQSPSWELIEPYFVNAGFYKVPDPTYGRYTLPPHPPHRILIDDPAVTHRYRRVFLRPFNSFADKHEAYDTTQIIHAEDVNLTEDEIYRGLQLGGRWVFYSTWELKEQPKGGWEGSGKGLGKDIILAHGLGDYGLRYTPHVHHFLKAGFRVIIPDLPSYGRSTGVHSYLPSLILLPSALHVVLTDVVQQDLAKGRDQRKVFLCGASMGGWTVLYYLLKYPPTLSATEVASQATQPDSTLPEEDQGKGYDNLERSKKEEKVRIDIAGAFVICPMVEVSKESRPSKFLEYIGRAISFIAGPLPFVKGVRGNVSDDPRVEEDFDSDPLCYHGLLRIGTGIAAVEAMTELEKRASEIDVPIRLIHGNKDRATSHLGTLKLFDRLPNTDKEIQIYDGYEHIMMKVGIDEADDEKRQRVLADWRNWLLQRC